jgi:hypothetical protein
MRFSSAICLFTHARLSANSACLSTSRRHPTAASMPHAARCTLLPARSALYTAPCCLRTLHTAPCYQQRSALQAASLHTVQRHAQVQQGPGTAAAEATQAGAACMACQPLPNCSGPLTPPRRVHQGQESDLLLPPPLVDLHGCSAQPDCVTASHSVGAPLNAHISLRKSSGVSKALTM